MNDFLLLHPIVAYVIVVWAGGSLPFFFVLFMDFRAFPPRTPPLLDVLCAGCLAPAWPFLLFLRAVTAVSRRK